MNGRTDGVRSTGVDTGIEHSNNEVKLGWSLKGVGPLYRHWCHETGHGGHCHHSVRCPGEEVTPFPQLRYLVSSRVWFSWHVCHLIFNFSLTRQTGVTWEEGTSLRKWLHHISLQTNQWGIVLINDWQGQAAHCECCHAQAGGSELYKNQTKQSNNQCPLSLFCFNSCPAWAPTPTSLNDRLWLGHVSRINASLNVSFIVAFIKAIESKPGQFSCIPIVLIHLSEFLG